MSGIADNIIGQDGEVFEPVARVARSVNRSTVIPFDEGWPPVDRVLYIGTPAQISADCADKVRAVKITQSGLPTGSPGLVVSQAVSVCDNDLICVLKEVPTENDPHDPVNHPSHYTTGKIECIDYIEDKKLDFHTGNAVKYITRAGKKDPAKEIQDLEKAIWYLQRKISLLHSHRPS